MGEIYYENRCKYRMCGTPLWQNGRGRRKEFCDDQCRQAEHRARLRDKEKQAARQEVASWGSFLPATLDQLAGYVTAGSRDTARKMADLILAEQLAGQSKKPLGDADLAELERAKQELEGLRNQIAKQQAARAVQAETVISRGKTIRDQKKAIEDLERQLAQVQAPATIQPAESGQVAREDLERQLAKTTDELEHARMVIAAREATIDEMSRAPHISSAIENAALRQSLESLRAATRKGEQNGNRDSSRREICHEMQAKEPRDEKDLVDVRGNYWEADRQDAVACMANGAELGWPDVYVFPYAEKPEHRMLMVRAGEENWYKYLRQRSSQNA